MTTSGGERTHRVSQHRIVKSGGWVMVTAALVLCPATARRFLRTPSIDLKEYEAFPLPDTITPDGASVSDDGHVAFWSSRIGEVIELGSRGISVVCPNMRTPWCIGYLCPSCDSGKATCKS